MFLIKVKAQFFYIVYLLHIYKEMGVYMYVY